MSYKPIKERCIGDFLCKCDISQIELNCGVDARVGLCEFMAKYHPEINYEVKGSAIGGRVYRTGKMGKVFKYDKEPIRINRDVINNMNGYSYESKTCCF